MATMSEIAKKAGVSKMTVSRVLNNQCSRHSKETVEKVLAAARKSSYSIDDMARAIKTGKSRTIGFLSYGISNEIASGIIEKASELDYSSRMIRSNLKTKKMAEDAYKKIVRERLSGLIILHNIADVLENILLENDFPFVYIGPRDKPEIKLKVRSDVQTSSDLIMNRLYNLGHRKIAFCSHSHKDHACAKRLECFKEYMKSKSLSFQNAVYIVDESKCTKQKLLNFINSKSRPTAIVCASQVATIAAITAIQSSGFKIPGDISLISYRDSMLAQSAIPTISAIREKHYEMGSKAAEILIEQIGRKKRKIVDKVFDVELIERESCAPPPE